MDTQDLMWSSEEAPASPSALPDSEEGWRTLVATWPSDLCSLLVLLRRDGSSGKTSPASCRPDQEGTLVPSSGRWQNSGMGGPTESWTLSTSEWPSDGAACLLSDVLETGGVPQRFYLSPKACEGILRRAGRRGKSLPPMLDAALRAQAGQGQSPHAQMQALPRTKGWTSMATACPSPRSQATTRHVASPPEN